MWKNKVHYYLRFILGMTRSEMLGTMSVFIFLILVDLAARWLEYEHRQQAILSFQPTLWTQTLIEMEKSNQASYRYEKRNASYSFTRTQPTRYQSTFSTHDFKKEKKQAWHININQADSLAWLALPGIGPAFAKRILAYREKLGGFHHASQLKEIYGLDSIWVKEHIAQFQVGKGIYRFLYINRVDWKEFRHPYLPYRQANLVLNYRKQHGPFQNLADLKKVQQLDEAVWQKLSPYLSFEP